ncbi:MAG: hypothetical protein RIR91_2045 [Verrucomicrobiota bacterium]
MPAASFLRSEFSNGPAKGVSVSEGAIAFTRMSGAHSAARLRVRPSRAPLAEAMLACIGMPCATATVEKSTTEAPPAALSAGNADCSAAMAPRTFTR